MTTEQALKIIDEHLSAMSLNRQGHGVLIEAMKVIRESIKK